MNEVRLKEVLVGIHQGITTSRYVVEEEPDGVRNLRCAIIKNTNLSESPLKITGEHELLTLENRPSLGKYKVRENDVLISQRFKNFCAASVEAGFLETQEEDGLTAVPANNAILLRPDPVKLSGQYLAVYLICPKGLRQVKRGSQPVKGKSKFAGVFRWTTPKAIGEIEIPLPSLREQKKIVNDYIGVLYEYDTKMKLAEINYQHRLDRLFR